MAVSAPEPALLVASILGRDLPSVERAVQGCAAQLGRLLFSDCGRRDDHFKR